MKQRFVRTLDFGDVVIRRRFTDGMFLANIELSDGTHAEIRTDFRSNQPFAVLFDEDWNPIDGD